MKRFKKISEKQSKQIEIFKKQLQKTNKKINLFSRKAEKGFEDLFQENLYSASLLESVFKNYKGKVLDLGSGNGLPGIFCALFYPKNLFVLCEKNRKKAEFLKSVAFEIGADNVEVLCGRAETTGLRFKKVLSQATGPLEEVLKILERVLDKKESEAFLWKNFLWEKEWPKKTPFKPDIFKSYQINSSKKVLLRIRL